MSAQYEVSTRRLTFWKPDNEAMFRAMGNAGWQLVSVQDRTCYFQRERAALSAPSPETPAR